jgi:predicted nucleic acid-binding protein
LIDETAARRVAQELGLRVSGLLAVIVRGKRRGIVSAVQPLLERLENEAYFWIGSDLRQRVLSAAGEEGD